MGFYSSRVSGSDEAVFVGGVEAAGDLQTSGSVMALHNVSASNLGIFVTGIETAGNLGVSGSSNFTGSVLLSGSGPNSGSAESTYLQFGHVDGATGDPGFRVARGILQFKSSNTASWEEVGVAAVASTAGAVDNRVATFSGADSLNGEANLTFDGSQLVVSGQVSGSGKAIFVGGVQAVGNVETSGSILAHHMIETDGDFSGSGKGIFVSGIETQGNLGVTGSTTIRGDLNVYGDDISGSGDLNIGGYFRVGHQGILSNISNHLTMSSDKDMVFIADSDNDDTSKFIFAVNGAPHDDGSIVLTLNESGDVSGSGKAIFVGGVQAVGNVETTGSLYVSSSAEVNGFMRTLGVGNSTVISSPTTVPANYNSVLFGPITITETLTITSTAAVKIKDIADA
jgi:hypothetical protein